MVAAALVIVVVTAALVVVVVIDVVSAIAVAFKTVNSLSFQTFQSP